MNETATDEEAQSSPFSLQKLDGCTCGGIGDTGAHFPNCAWN